MERTLELVSALRTAALGNEDAGAVVRAALGWLDDLSVVPSGLVVLGRGGDDALEVLAASGNLAGTPTGACVTIEESSPDGSSIMTVATLREGEGEGRVLGRLLWLPVDGAVVAGVLVELSDGERGVDLDSLRFALVTLDRELDHLDVRVAHRERVKELDALRGVHMALRLGLPRQVLLHRVAATLANGMQHVDVARAEVHLDDHAVTAGASGQLVVQLARPLLVDGRRRGEVRVGYVEERAFLDPAEPNLLEAVTETIELHLVGEEARGAARVSEQQLARAFTSLPAALWTVDDEDREVTVLAVGEKVPLGPPGLRFSLDRWDDPAAPLVRDATDRAFAGEAVTWELPWEEGWWELRVEPLVADADGRVRRVLGFALDVTEHQRARELEARLAAIVEGAELAMVGVDRDGRIMSWNQGASRLFGWPAGHVIDRPVDLLLPAEVDERTGWEGEQAREGGGEAAYVEARRRHREGDDLEVGIWTSPIRGADGATTGVACIYQDLTERNEARRALERREAELRLLADSAQDVVYRLRLRPEPQLEYISPVSASLLGFSPDRFLEDWRLLADRVHPEDAPQFEAGSQHDEPETVRFRWRRVDGRWIWLEDRRTPRIEHGEVVEVTGIARDVTDQAVSEEALRAALERERRAADELRRLDDLKTGFLRAVSHELRTPLTAIIGFAETASRLVAASPEQQRQYLARVVTNAQRLEGLVSDLLDVDRLARGQVHPRLEPTRLDELVARVVRRTEADTHVLETDLQPVEATVDATMIERAVDNLVRNAVRHTPEGTRILVRTAVGEALATVTVEDDGPGVPVELRERVFEPFEQGSQVHATASPGTGIGLSLVRRFVDLHDGTVTLDEGVAGGARFTVRLPVEDGSGGPPPPQLPL